MVRVRGIKVDLPSKLAKENVIKHTKNEQNFHYSAPKNWAKTSRTLLLDFQTVCFYAMLWRQKSVFALKV
jgi:hypothetical protein